MCATSPLTNVRVRQLPVKLDKNVQRVVALPFNVSAYSQVSCVYERVRELDAETVEAALETVMLNFNRRHENFEERLRENYALAARMAREEDHLTDAQKLLVGAYFTMEYSVEAAALFNPSITPHPDQQGVPEGGLRFIMSLRAVGEGHLSSTVFQTGLITAAGAVAIDPPGDFTTRTRVKPDHHYHKELFRRRLEAMGVNLETADTVLERLEDQFTIDDLEQALGEAEAEEVDDEGPTNPHRDATSGAMRWLARANYHLQLDPDDNINDLILFPRSDNEQQGIEDMRLVRFVEDDGEATYYGTYSAFDGRHVLPMLMETRDFRAIDMHTLNGDCVQNKGMALFPRRVDGHYCMCSRNDGRNLYIMFSDMAHFWESAELLAEPKHPWELRIIGNCGSPLETPEGWLLLTHGVGPMRRYCIGAMLLDLDDPFRILGRLREPMLVPTEEDREGYVPNVVYSCGGLIHNDRLILPYAVSDTATRMASVDVHALVDRLKADGP